MFLQTITVLVVHMIQNRKFALVFRIAALLIGCAGVLSITGALRGEFNSTQLMYYTIQSNLVAIVLFGMLLTSTIKSIRQDGWHGSCSFFPRFEMVVMIDILLTLLVFWIMLVPQTFSMGDGYPLWSFSNLAVHLVTPLFCIVDYFLFAASKHLKYRDVYGILIFPYCYIVLVTIAGFAGFTFHPYADGTVKNFPYYFLDWNQLGLQVFTYIIGLTLFFLVISHLLYLLDRKWEKPLFGIPKASKKTPLR